MKDPTISKPLIIATFSDCKIIGKGIGQLTKQLTTNIQ
jgi:hypothetical protein